MKPHHQTIAWTTIIGLLLGIMLYFVQPSQQGQETMNPMGVIAFVSLGASVGCFVCDGNQSRRRR
ncbi:MAG: hypothetical protein K1X71_07745 [Pirellulales bacterium]|nr:hypothetical protein [Pirellulales bacterium]